MLIRAKTEGNCGAVITWFSDIEKQQALAGYYTVIIFSKECFLTS